MTRLNVVLAVVLAVGFCALISVGVGMVYLPAGLIAGGLLGLAGLYVGAYLRAGAGR